MAAEIMMGLSAFKTMFDLAKGLKDMNDATTRNSVAIELQEKILAAQAQQAALIDHIGQLEAKVTKLEAWDADKQRYKLEEIPPGVFVYSLKPDMANGDPPHYLCQTCYQRGKKSILHADQPFNGVRNLTCHECGTRLRTGHSQQPRINYRPGREFP